jgi:Flp pilus assembly protein TadD
MSDEALKLICVGCGSTLAYSATDQALKCPYCGSTTEIPKIGEELPTAVRSIIPLTVDVTALVDAVYQHLASGDMTPDHLLEHASISKKERFYAPAFSFSGSYEAQWTASFGYDRQEQYTVYESRYENGRNTKVPVTKTKIVTDWRPVNGNDSGMFGVVAYAGKRQLNNALNVTSLIDGKAAKLEPFDESYTSGITTEPFESSESEVYSDRGTALVDSVIAKSVHRHAQGDRQKDWHWTADIRKQAEATLVPLCHAIYEFEGKQYNVWLSGSNPSQIVADALPVDKGRKQTLNSGFFPFWGATIAAGIAIFALDSTWVVPVSIVLVTLLYGVLRKRAIIGYSHKIRQSLLAKRKAISTKSENMSESERLAAVGAGGKLGKPLLAITAQDRWILPLATVLAMLVTLAPGWLQSRLPATVQETSQVASQVTAAQPEQVQRAESVQANATSKSNEDPATATVAANRATPSAATPAPSSNDARNDTQPVASTQTGTETGTDPSKPSTEGNLYAGLRASPIGNLLDLAEQGDWAAVDKGVLDIQNHVEAQTRGNRNAARVANQQGLMALQANDLATARATFEQGVSDDPSDIEVRNNLAYVLVKTQDARATDVLTSVLMQAPDRTSGWANLAEATASDSAISASALKLAVRFSANRERTLDVLRQVAGTNASAQYRAIATSVLNSVNLIPAMPNDRSQTALAQGAPIASSSSPSERTDYAQPTQKHATDEVGAAIHQMLAQGQSCFQKKQYTCAITSASNALSLRANDSEALELKANAQAAQDQAMSSIEIK